MERIKKEEREREESEETKETEERKKERVTGEQRSKVRMMRNRRGAKDKNK